MINCDNDYNDDHDDIDDDDIDEDGSVNDLSGTQLRENWIMMTMQKKTMALSMTCQLLMPRMDATRDKAGIGGL